MHNQLLITVIGLVAGAAGYLITTFCFQPILRFFQICSRVMSDLVFYANAISANGVNQAMKERLMQRVEANRRHSADLIANYFELPKLYRKYLRWRGIEPDRASSELMGLSNTTDRKDALERIKSIQQYLKTPRLIV